jgi:plastocyanin
MAGMVMSSGVGQLLPPPSAAHGDGEHGAAEPTAAPEQAAAQPTAAPAPTAAPEPTAAPAAPAPSEAIVSMIDFAFEPAEIRVPAGTTIVWPNNGQKQHSATAVDGSFDTGLYGPGASRSITFDTPGTFRYYCVLHAPPDGSSGMSGTIIVE